MGGMCYDGVARSFHIALTPARFLLAQVPGHFICFHASHTAAADFPGLHPGDNFGLGPPNGAKAELDRFRKIILRHGGIDRRAAAPRDRFKERLINAFGFAEMAV